MHAQYVHFIIFSLFLDIFKETYDGFKNFELATLVSSKFSLFTNGMQKKINMSFLAYNVTK